MSEDFALKALKTFLVSYQLFKYQYKNTFILEGLDEKFSRKPAIPVQTLSHR